MLAKRTSPHGKVRDSHSSPWSFAHLFVSFTVASFICSRLHRNTGAHRALENDLRTQRTSAQVCKHIGTRVTPGLGSLLPGHLVPGLWMDAPEGRQCMYGTSEVTLRRCACGEEYNPSSYQCQVYVVRGEWPMAVRFTGEGGNESLLHPHGSKDWPDWGSKGKEKRQTHGHAEKLGSGGLGSIVRNHSNPDQHVYYMQGGRVIVYG